MRSTSTSRMAARMPYCTKKGPKKTSAHATATLLVVVVPEVRGEQRKERNREEHARERQAGPQGQRAGDVFERHLVAGRRHREESRRDEGGEHEGQRANRGAAADERLPAVR